MVQKWDYTINLRFMHSVSYNTMGLFLFYHKQFHTFYIFDLNKTDDTSVLKGHFLHLAVNFLPQYVITLLFSLTCVLTITRRKRPKSGPKTGFRSDFYTLLTICVPPIILGQVLRYFPTVVAIHMNSYVTSYDPCADAIE